MVNTKKNNICKPQIKAMTCLFFTFLFCYKIRKYKCRLQRMLGKHLKLCFLLTFFLTFFFPLENFVFLFNIYVSVKI